MSPLWLRVRAPFAAYRWFQAGVYRATSPIMPPSAAYGLLLNLAGIEMRALPAPGEAGEVATLIREDLPALDLAIGAIREAERATLYQQLHSYPVGNSGANLAPRARGAKFWIVPVRREVLIDLDMMIGVREDVDGIFERIAAGLRGENSHARYGLPFAGDNSFLFDDIAIVPEPMAAAWYAPVEAKARVTAGSVRLTTHIDRADNSKTQSPVFAPGPIARVAPEAAWIRMPGPSV